MRDSKQQRCAQQHAALKVPQNATNGNKHINEASKQTFANNRFKISLKTRQSVFSIRSIYFNAFRMQNDDKVVCILIQIDETVQILTYANFPI